MSTSIYAELANFNDFLEHGKGTRKAVVYDQFHSPEHIVRHVEGTRHEILAQYKFYKECYPDRSLGLTSEEYYQHLMQSYAKRCNRCGK